jgi:hypothetical protein
MSASGNNGHCLSRKCGVERVQEDHKNEANLLCVWYLIPVVPFALWKFGTAGVQNVLLCVEKFQL